MYGQHQPAGTSAPKAGFWIRLAAALVDALIYGIPLGIVGAALGVSTNGQQVLTLVVGLVYFSLQEGGATGQTVGKRLCGIRVVDERTGQTIDVGRAMARYLVSILSGLACAVGYLWMLWDANKQTWHDKASHTVVIRV